MKEIKQRIKEMKCKIIGCVFIHEIYAIKSHNKARVKYKVVESDTCTRCGRVNTKILSRGLSRVDLLKKEWFITEYQD